MRRPVRYLVVGVLVLLTLGAPFWNLQSALPDDRVLPASAPSRQVQDALRSGFTALNDSPVQVVLTEGDFDAASPQLDRYARALSRLPDVARVDGETGVYVDGRRVRAPGPASAAFASTHGTLVTVEPSVEAMSARAEQLARAVRAEPAPQPVLVGGRTAELIDVKAALTDKLPWAIGLIAGATFVALLLLFGSVLVPVKALLLNTLSLSASFGAMVWIFQEGRLAGLLDFTPTGTIDTTIPILMFCMAFGLSMDYEVFIMSRIKEAHDRHGDSDRAVLEGIGSTGGIVTTLALILAVVFACFATSSVTFIKLMGVGLATAVLIDATIARGVLVPAMMRISRRANWWAPRWLLRLRNRGDHA
jgi:RND superfamily putative drug exporter